MGAPANNKLVLFSFSELSADESLGESKPEPQEAATEQVQDSQDENGEIVTSTERKLHIEKDVDCF